eukprot:5890000-Alexandrium_andersonii.AAC.1
MSPTANHEQRAVAPRFAIPRYFVLFCIAAYGIARVPAVSCAGGLPRPRTALHPAGAAARPAQKLQECLFMVQNKRNSETRCSGALLVVCCWRCVSARSSPKWGGREEERERHVFFRNFSLEGAGGRFALVTGDATGSFALSRKL